MSKKKKKTNSPSECPRCGNILIQDDDSKYCDKCGYFVDKNGTIYGQKGLVKIDFQNKKRESLFFIDRESAIDNIVNEFKGNSTIRGFYSYFHNGEIISKRIF